MEKVGKLFAKSFIVFINTLPEITLIMHAVFGVCCVAIIVGLFIMSLMMIPMFGVYDYLQLLRDYYIGDTLILIGLLWLMQSWLFLFITWCTDMESMFVLRVFYW